MKRKILSLLLSVSMLISTLAAPVSAATSADSTYAPKTFSVNPTTFAVTCSVNGVMTGLWEMDEDVEPPASDLPWSQSGYSSIKNYVIDVIGNANLASQRQIVVNGCKSMAAAEKVRTWLDNNVRFSVTSCPHTTTAEIGPGKEPVPCHEMGITPGLKCTICNGIIYPQQIIPFTHASTTHTDGKAATCTSDGFTAGEVCSNCNATISIAGMTIPSTGHSWTDNEICRNCGRSRAAGVEIPTYSISINESDQSVTTADANYACPGTLVTLVTGVKEGAELISVTVTDAQGNELEVIENSDGTCSFTILEGNATVNVKSGLLHKVKIDNISEGGSISADYENAGTGRLVTIMAQPDSGQMVESLTVATSYGPVNAVCTAENVYTFEMPDADVTVSAKFCMTPPVHAYLIYADLAAHGRVVPDVTDALSGTTVGVTVTPDEGYRVASISILDEAGSSVGNIPSNATRFSFTMPEKNVTIRATFEPAIFSVTEGQVRFGSIHINPKSAQVGADVIVTLTPQGGYMVDTFYAKSLDGMTQVASTNETTLTFKMPGFNVVIVAECTPLPPEYTVTVAEPSNGGVGVFYESSKLGSAVTIRPEANFGYEVDRIKVFETANPTANVKVNGPDVDGLYTFNMPEGDVTVEVAFKAVSNAIEILNSVNGHVEVQERYAPIGTEITVRAFPDDGYKATMLAIKTESEGIQTVPFDESGLCTFTMPGELVQLDGIFDELPPENTVTVDQPEKGSVDVKYNNSREGAPIIVTATPNEGYLLSSIIVTSADGETRVSASPDSPYTFNMPAFDVKVTAEFTKILVDHDIILRCSAGGAVTSAFENRKAGTTISVYAKAQPDFVVDTVTVVTGGVEIPHSEVDDNGFFTFTMPDSSVTVTVNFKAVEHEIVADKGVTLSQKTAPKNTLLTATVTPDEGYRVVGLVVTSTEGPVEAVALTNNRYMFVMPNCPVTVSAQYEAEARDYSVTIAATQNGTVTPSVTTCKAGTMVTVTTKPAEGYTLDRVMIRVKGAQTVDVSDISNGMFTFEMPEGNVEISATFTAGSYHIMPQINGGGSMRIDTAVATMGQTVNVTLTPDENYVLSDFTVTRGNGTNVPVTKTATGYRFTMPGSNVTITASFAKVADPTYAVSFVRPTNGTLQVSPISAKAGATITVTATPNNGYELERLNILTTDGSVIATATAAGKYTFVMPAANVTVSATFKSNLNPVTPTKTTHGQFSMTAESAEPGRIITIITKPDSGYMVNAVIVTDITGKTILVANPSENNYRFTMPSTAVTVAVEFAAVPQFSVTKQSAASGSITLSKTQAKAGEQVTFTATANEGYQIDAVTVRATANSASIETTVLNGVYTFTMPDSNVTVSATFKEVIKPKPDYTITVAAPDNGYVQSSASAAKAGSIITVTMQPRTGYEVDTINVTANGEAIDRDTIDSTTFTFVMPESNVNISVTFKTQPRSITVENSAHGAAEVNPEAAVPGTRVVITGEAETGYEVANVVVTQTNGTSVPVVKATNGQYSFTMPDSNVKVKATFQAVVVPTVQYDLIIANPVHGTVKSSHTTAPAGTTVTVTSNPAAGYELDAITVTSTAGSKISTTDLGNGGFSFVMPASSVSIAVTFKATTYLVKTTTNEHGIVRTDIAKAASGDKVTITPVANAGYEVESVSVKTSAVISVAVTADKDGTYSFTMPAGEVVVSANYKQVAVAPKTYAVTVAAAAHGTVQAAYADSIEGARITILTTADNGYEVDSVQVTDREGKAITLAAGAEKGTYTFTMPASDVTVKATFKATAKPGFDIALGSSSHGTTTLSSTTAIEGALVTVTTKPDTNYVVNTIGVQDASGNSIPVKTEGNDTYFFTMPASKVSVSVTYKVVSTSSVDYKITINAASFGVVTAAPAQAPAGTQVVLHVAASNGYSLDNIIVRDSRGLPIATLPKLDGTYVFTMPASDVTVAPFFVPASSSTTPLLKKAITLKVSGLGKVESSCETGTPGTTVTITATPDSGFYLGTMRATDAGGHPITLTKKDNETFQFVLPTSNVTVYASFYAISSNPAVPIMPGTNVDPDTSTQPSTPNTGTPSIPDSPFDPVNSYRLPFSDMGKTSWFFLDVQYLYQRGIINGVSATEFGPSSLTSRGQVATMLYRLAGQPLVGGAAPFQDVEPHAYYSNAISWAASMGIVNGYSNNTFGPSDNVSREQLVTILYRYVLSQGGKVDVSNAAAFRAFGDSDAVSGYAISAMTWACNAGIIQGNAENMLKPSASATRAEISAILHRFCEKYPVIA